MATNKKKSSNSKSSGASKAAMTRKRNQEKKIRQEEIKQDLILGASIIVTILLFVSNLGLGGFVGNAVSGFLFGLFGILAYIFPFILVIATFFAVANKENSIAIIKLIAFAIAMIFLCMLFELILHEDEYIGPVDAFLYGFEYKTGGGFLGGLLAMVFIKGFGLYAAYAICIIIMAICLAIMLEKSYVKWFHQISEDANSDEAKEIRAQRKKEAELRRAKRHEEQAAHKNNNNPTRNLHEIKVEDTGIMEAPVTPRKDSDEVSEIKINIFDDVDVSDIDRIPLKSNQDSITSVRFGDEEVADTASEEFVNDSIISTAENSARIDARIFDIENPVQETIPAEIMDTNYSTDESFEDEDEDIEEYGVAEADEYPAQARNTSEKLTEADTIPVTDADLNKTKTSNYKFPPISLLNKIGKKGGTNKSTLQETAEKLQQTLINFGVDAKVTNATCGPAVTRFEIQPAMGVKVSKIVNLTDDIKLNLAASDIRIEAPIPGKSAIGIEVPNKEATAVSFRELVESEDFKAISSNIAFAAGRDIGGKIIISDIAKMPHLLIAGATGSGKSVCINTIIMSILYHAKPDDVKFIMIDPKVVELSVYNGIPHLLIPVVTDPKKAAGALQWAVREMTDRYNKFAEAQVRDMKGYNELVSDHSITLPSGTILPAEKMPQIVVIVDELADLMMVASSEVEASICRLAQLARAAGIHLIIATQRPSVNVITGLIKANMPSRIAFAVTSGVDSRTILDMNGAEKLLGKGDMLYYPQGYSKPLRVQGAFVSDDDVKKVVEYIKKHSEGASYDESIEITAVESGSTAISSDSGSNDRDEYFEQAGRLLIEKEKGSIGMLQRNFKIGFNRAARIMDQLCEAGVVAGEEGTKPRKVLVSLEEFEQILSSK